ncbi:MAG: HAD family phosphatase [Candidatus Wildermuthbacteria bacterium]|nr:HAD family phosphatase [Candidatus Wildermuthbacteria bacterium]
MKNIKEITQKELEMLKAITFDIDGVIIPTGTELRESADGTELFMKSKQLSRQFIENVKELKRYLKVNFSSGRNILYLKSLVNEIFDKDIFLQAENGNISLFEGVITHPSYPADYFHKLQSIRERVKTMMAQGDKRVRGFEPKLFILTTHSEQIEEIPNIVKEADPEGELYCLWTNEGYDIGNKLMNKGKGIEKLAQYLNISQKEIMTTGNNYNDEQMLKAGTGVTVEPGRVEAEYFIEHAPNELGGELLAEFLLGHYKGKR